MDAAPTSAATDELLIRSAGLAAEQLPPASGAPPIPDRLPGYQIIREIRVGGQGVVYQAVHEATDRDVAIKVFHTRDGLVAADLDRFTREVESLREISHANVVAIHEAGIEGRVPYIVMAYVEGCPLDEFVTSRPLDERAAMRIFERLADGVHAAHVRGVIHRDLKPGNILIDDHGEPRVLDFGLAKMLGPAGHQPAITHTGQFLGTLPWASPEQVDGRADGVDVRTDVYALGAVLFYMLTGQAPFDMSGSHRDVLNRIVTQPPIRPRDLRSDISDDIQTIILRCLAKEKDRRYQSASELAAEARRWLAGRPIEAKRDSMLYVARKFVARNRLAVALTLVVALSAAALAWRETRRAGQLEAFVGSLGGLLESINQSDEEPSAAELERRMSRLRRRYAFYPREVSATAFELCTFTANGAARTGRYAEAMNSRALALEEAIRAYGAGSQRVIECRNDLAVDAMSAGDLERGEREARLACDLARKHLGPANPTVAGSWNSLAQVLLKRDRLDEARDATLRSVAAIRQSKLTNPKNLSNHLKHSADLLFFNGCRRRELGLPAEAEFSEVEALHRENLGIARDAYRDDPAMLAHHVHSFSVFLRETERFDEAELLAREAMDLRERFVDSNGPDSFYRWASTANLGVIRMYQGRYDEAQDYLLKAFHGLDDQSPRPIVHELQDEFAGHLAELHRLWAASAPGERHEEVAELWSRIAGER